MANQSWQHRTQVVADFVKQANGPKMCPAESLSNALTSSTSLTALLVLFLCTITVSSFSYYYQRQASSNISYDLKINSYIPTYFDLSKLKSGRAGYADKYSREYNRTLSAKHQFIYTKIRSAKVSISEAQRITRAILNTSSKTGLDPFLIGSIIMAESAFKIRAQSPVGALGLMQLMPNTARYIAKKIGDHVPNRNMILTPEHNIRLGAAYFLYLSKMYQGDINKILVAYNWGPANVDLAFYRKLRGIPTVTKTYVAKIKGNIQSWHKDFSNRKVAFQYASLYSEGV